MDANARLPHHGTTSMVCCNQRSLPHKSKEQWGGSILLVDECQPGVPVSECTRPLELASTKSLPREPKVWGGSTQEVEGGRGGVWIFIIKQRVQQRDQVQPMWQASPRRNQWCNVKLLATCSWCFYSCWSLSLSLFGTQFYSDSEGLGHCEGIEACRHWETDVWKNQPTLLGVKSSRLTSKPNQTARSVKNQNTVRAMSGEQKEELKEMALEAKGSKVSPSRSKEKGSGGKKANVHLFQAKTTPHPPPNEPACQCAQPPKKVNSADPIKGNR